MTKILYSRLNKALLSNYPPVNFTGRIIVVLNENEAQKAIDYLLTQRYVGIDTETRPSFKKGRQNKVSLLQVSSRDYCFLFRLKIIHSLNYLKTLFESQEVCKIGLSLHDDIHSLREILDFKPTNFLDIQSFIGNIGIRDMSLQKIYANLFQEKISKSQQLPNWDADILSEKQKLYAAIDAWACLKIYEEYSHLTTTKNYELIITDETEHEQLPRDIS